MKCNVKSLYLHYKGIVYAIYEESKNLIVIEMRTKKDLIMESYPPVRTRDKIMDLLRENNKLSAAKLAKQVGIGVKGVEKRLAKLKEEGLIERVGAARGGHWVVIGYK